MAAREKGWCLVIRHTIPCPRCGSSLRLPEGGICPLCDDTGVIPIVVGGQGRSGDEVARDSFSVVGCLLGGAILVLAGWLLLGWLASPTTPAAASGKEEVRCSTSRG